MSNTVGSEPACYPNERNQIPTKNTTFFCHCVYFTDVDQTFFCSATVAGSGKGNVTSVDTAQHGTLVTGNGPEVGRRSHTKSTHFYDGSSEQEENL